MYFEFEDHRPETPHLDESFSRRESAIYSVGAHILVILAILYLPELSWFKATADQAPTAAELQQQDAPRFVFVQPKLDMPAPAPPRADLSDQDRRARTIERAPNPTNPLPFARGNSSERTESHEPQQARDEGPAPEPSPAEENPAGQNNNGNLPALADSASNAYLRTDAGSSRPKAPGGLLGEALQNLERYVQRETFDNPQGGDGSFGPSLQFDTKGVEFGPWIRRFLAQIKRNWFVPYAAMSFKGHVVLTFNVHKDGSLTDLSVIQPSSVGAFTTAASNALLASNPTQPLPPEYPADQAFFTLTFYYNETPPGQ